MTCGIVSGQGWPLNVCKNNKEKQTWDCYRVAATTGRLIEVTKTETAFV